MDSHISVCFSLKKSPGKPITVDVCTVMVFLWLALNLLVSVKNLFQFLCGTIVIIWGKLYCTASQKLVDSICMMHLSSLVSTSLSSDIWNIAKWHRQNCLNHWSQ